MDFLWVIWFGRDPNNYRSGWKAKRLHRLGFIPADEPKTFGFLDPRYIIRGVHLIPRFAYGRTDNLLPPSISRPLHENNEDRKFYYVNMFVDRDMLMRFRGGGVGHKSTRNATRGFFEDHDPLDRIVPAAPNEGTISEVELESEGGGSEDPLVTGEETMEGDDDAADGSDNMALDSEVDEYGYGGLDQEEEQTDDEDGEGNSDENDRLEADDDALGPEDGEDEADDDLEGYGDL